MSKRRASWRLQGNILDARPGTEHLESLTVLQRGLLTRQQRQPFNGPTCHCRPRAKHQLGGCDPVLIVDGDAVRPVCRTCLKRLDSSEHRRRDQQHVIGLSRLPLDHLDLADLEAIGLLIDPSRIEPGEVPQEVLR